ncbi:type II secretion system protein [Halolamina salifodinae]|uniref:Type II secretion system protein n=1 Tax=Halolamina salifodinae TaxID=1202767 RepID=A0A8T4GU26_9EURY|nr:type II secretion system protein [Halolamina salifodinae]MBP1985583.1 hypothetical protein [Halolamina salifodinae]
MVARRSPLEQAVTTLAERWPREPSVDDELVDACNRLGWPSAADVVAFGEAAGVAVAAVGTLVVTTTGALSLLPLALVLGAVPPLAARHVPVAVAELAATRAVGDAPALVGRLTLRLRIEPSLERATAFAADAGESTLAESLHEHARRAKGTPSAGLQSFGEEWGEKAPAIQRAAALAVDAAESPPEARDRACERALSAVRTGVEERAAAFAGEIRAPLTGLYAFGVLLPLALVGVLPAARLAGVNVGIGALTALYVVILPGGLLAASGWLLAQRPVSFPPPEIGRSQPEIPDRRGTAGLLGTVSGGATAAVCLVVLPWVAPVAAAGVGVGIALLWLFAPARRRRREIRETEAGIPDALGLTGRRVADGVAVERALAEVAETLPDRTGDLLTDAAGRGERLGVTVEGTFFGRFGVLRHVPSPRARDAGRLFALAAREGAPAGDALVEAGEHLRELRRVEREARRELATVTGTLSNTAALFGPLVGGVSVAMVGRLPDDASGSLGGGSTTGPAASTANTALDVASLGPVVGVYVLLLAAILTALATALERGLDRSLLGYRVGIALPTATGAYVAAVVAAKAVL